jgi:hypothetical protein
MNGKTNAEIEAAKAAKKRLEAIKNGTLETKSITIQRTIQFPTLQKGNGTGGLHNVGSRGSSGRGGRGGAMGCGGGSMRQLHISSQ